MKSLFRSGQTLPGLLLLGILLVLLACAAGCTQQPATPPATPPATTPPQAGMPNPASVYCEQNGGILEIKTGTSGEYGMCTFRNGTTCEEWALFRKEGCKPGIIPETTTAASVGMPNPASVACVNAGGNLEIRKDAAGGEYGMCMFKNGTSCEEWALFRGEGCRPGVAVETINPAGSKKMVTLTSADNGRTEDIAQGTKFAVQLEENPTTGFQWEAKLSNGLELVSDDYQTKPHAEGMVGVGGTHTWIILAKDSGTQKFSATYRRSWEPVTGTETTFSVNINVVKS